MEGGRSPFLTRPDGEPWTLDEFTAGAETGAHISHHERLSDLFGDFRLDAEAYSPEVIQVYEHLEVLKTVRLGDHAFITDGQHGYHIVDSDSPIRHLTARCIQDWFVDDSEVERLALETHEKNLRSSCEPDDILLSTAGTLGKAAIVTPDVLPANMDQDIARIHLETDVIEPWYLAAFLNSSVGRLQSDRVSTGQVQRHIALGKVRDFRIPVGVDQASVAELVKKAFAERKKSANLHVEAEALLLAELGLDALDLSHQPTYTQNASQVWAVGRLDSDYWGTEHTILVDHLKSRPHSFLGALADFANGATPRGANYLAEGIPFLRIQNVGKNRLELDDVVYIDEETHNDLLRRSHLQPGDALITITGRIGTSAVVPEDMPIGNINQHIVRLRPRSKQTNPYYLAAFLNSRAGRLQTEREAYGTTREALPYYCLERIIVPRTPETLQGQIEGKIREAEESLKESKRMLEEAKQRVEEMVLRKES